MKRLILTSICTLAALGMLSGVVLAQAKSTEGEKKAEGRHHGQQMLDKIAKELNLTDEQRKQVTDVFKSHREAMEKWHKDNGPKLKDLHEQIRKAEKDGDKDKAQSLRAEARKVMETRKALWGDLKKQLGEVLSDEQEAKALDIMGRKLEEAGKAMQRMADWKRLELSDEQKEATKKIMSDAKAEAEKAEGREAKAKIYREAHEKVHKTVLTEDQRKKLGEARKGPREKMAEALGLTDEQKSQAKEIMKKAFEEAKKAETPEAKHKIMQEAREKVHKEVLTDQQRKKAEELHKKMHRGREKPASCPKAAKSKGEKKAAE